MKTIETDIGIAAPIDTVWAVLTQDLPRSPQAFGIVRIEGALTMGANIKLWSEVMPNRAFALTVEVMDKPNKMEWRGGMPFGLFTGQRSFTLTQTNTGCHFHLREAFSGVMSGLITRSMPDLKPSFDKFARTLKTKAEQK